MHALFLVFALHHLILILTAALANEVCPVTELSLCLVLGCETRLPSCCERAALLTEVGTGDGQTEITSMKKQKFREVK